MKQQQWKKDIVFLKVGPKGSIYNANTRGPKIDVCGSPQGIGADEGNKIPVLT